MKVIAHQDKCVAAGQCAMLAPKVFDQRDEDGVVILLDEHPSADHDTEVRQAAAACPARAIAIEEEAQHD
jgi:ferredoxin